MTQQKKEKKEKKKGLSATSAHLSQISKAQMRYCLHTKVHREMGFLGINSAFPSDTTSAPRQAGGKVGTRHRKSWQKPPAWSAYSQPSPQEKGFPSLAHGLWNLSIKLLATNEVEFMNKPRERKPAVTSISWVLVYILSKR